MSLYGLGTVTFNDRLDLSAGARFDHENKKALLGSRFVPGIFPDNVVNEEESFSNVSPQFSAAWRFQPGRAVYANVARGYKAGGFNPASLPGSEIYGEEYAWHTEAGVKTLLAGDRVRFNAAVFLIDWQDLQLNVPNIFAPGQFYIANVGNASSRGVELEVVARAHESLDVFSTFGITRARFDEGSVSRGADVSDKRIPNTPEYTATLGAQFSRAVSSAATLYGAGEITFFGSFHYDDANTVEQEAYSLANLRAGVRGKYLFAEAWLRNAFDTSYVPVAFEYPGLAPSGFIGEPGRPRTFGLRAGVRF
jgi:outer membrane receptor protein involved in Fe transport